MCDYVWSILTTKKTICTKRMVVLMIIIIKKKWCSKHKEIKLLVTKLWEEMEIKFYFALSHRSYQGYTHFCNLKLGIIKQTPLIFLIFVLFQVFSSCIVLWFCRLPQLHSTNNLCQYLFIYFSLPIYNKHKRYIQILYLWNDFLWLEAIWIKHSSL